MKESCSNSVSERKHGRVRKYLSKLIFNI